MHEVLRSPGQPLDAQTRAFMEPRFRHDFSGVRIHTDAKAAESARAVNALAYTVGHDVVFGTGRYVAGSFDGRRILAHELAHVVQQAKMKRTETGNLEVQPANAVAEQEADQMALRLLSGSPNFLNIRLATSGLQRLTCESILNAKEVPAEERKGIGGTEVERQIRTDFISQNGSRTTRFPIPDASSMPFRTGCGEEAGEALGTGTPDLMYINGNRIELAEVKIGTFDCLLVAEKQVGNYVIKGNAPENANWRASLGLAKDNAFKLMPTARFTPSPLLMDGKRVSVGWCEPGIVVYKIVSRDDQDTFLCSNLSDKGMVDRFLTRVMDKAQVTIERYINQIAAEIYKKIDEEMAKQKFPISAFILKGILEAFKEEIVTMLREEVQTSLRQYLQQSLNVFCATAAAKGIVSLQEMLDKLDKEKPLVLVPALVAVSARLAKEMAKGVWNEAKKVVLPIVAGVIAAIVVALCILEMGLCTESRAPEGMPRTLPNLAPAAGAEKEPDPGKEETQAAAV